MKASKIENIEELRNDLLSVYAELKSGKAELSTVRTQSDIAGKIMKSLALQTAEKIRTKDSTAIEFLKGN